ncbi:MAG TPA: hypothetical protein VKE27_04080 [Candidatus Dormibacteraeota bacterium]|nr:hypothetical protein [Candidatus Dormibacteraeota bacterium]
MHRDDDLTGIEMPTLREIELDLALANPGWKALLDQPHQPNQSPTPVGAPGPLLGRRSTKVTKRPPGV